MAFRFRKDEFAAARRTASRAAKETQKQQDVDGDVDMKEDDNDESADEDPLADLEEMEHRVQAGTLSDNKQHASAESPTPFNGSRVGYLADGESEYVAGFRVYE